MMIKVTCPQCGAVLDMDSSRESMFCSQCGSQIVLSPAQTPAPVQNTYQSSKLVVRFRANRYDLPLLVRVDGGALLRVANGFEQEFALSPGRHQVRVKVGNRNYARFVDIKGFGETVIMEVSWFGSAKINVTDSSVAPVAPAQNVYPASVGNQPYQPTAQPLVQPQAPARRSRKLLIWGIITAAIFSFLTLVYATTGVTAAATTFGILTLGGAGMIIAYCVTGNRE